MGRKCCRYKFASVFVYEFYKKKFMLQSTEMKPQKFSKIDFHRGYPSYHIAVNEKIASD